jgi:hypothetical protein
MQTLSIFLQEHFLGKHPEMEFRECEPLPGNLGLSEHIFNDTAIPRLTSVTA